MFRAFRTASRLTRSSAIRTYSTEASSHAYKPSSDVPWIVASIAVFGPTIFYLTSPPSPAAHGHSVVDHSSGKEQHASPTHKESESEPEAEAEPEVEEEKVEEVVEPVGKSEKKEIELNEKKVEQGEDSIEPIPQEIKAEGGSAAKAEAKSKQPEGQFDSEKVKDDKAREPEVGRKEGSAEKSEDDE